MKIREFVSLPKLESSRNVTSKVISNKARKSKSTEQYDSSFSFASTAHVTQWSNYLTQRAEILARRSNLTPQLAKNTVNELSVVSVVPPGEQLQNTTYLPVSVCFEERGI